MNVFATLKTVFFGSKFLSAPVPSDGTPRRDFISALNGLMPLCRTIPGVHLAVDIREGRVALVVDWTPRTDGNALAGTYHYIVSDEDGVKEVSKNPAPYPAFIISNDCLYIYRLATSVDFAGPPPVITMIRSRHWKDAITDVISTKTLVGFNNGNVIFQKVCQEFAPSSFAAS